MRSSWHNKNSWHNKELTKYLRGDYENVPGIESLVKRLEVN